MPAPSSTGEIPQSLFASVFLQNAIEKGPNDPDQSNPKIKRTKPSEQAAFWGRPIEQGYCVDPARRSYIPEFSTEVKTSCHVPFDSIDAKHHHTTLAGIIKNNRIGTNEIKGFLETPAKKGFELQDSVLPHTI